LSDGRLGCERLPEPSYAEPSSLEPSLWAATAPPATPVSGRQLVALVFAAQVLVQIGASFWPALLPGMVALWD
jgi:hypothetical protein